ncbi:MAG: histidine phosphatase family protein, partial [Anaerolineae bacterium]|nr:histidine phosphatase family protein [Anaerolineae bacterium]
MFMHLYFIRHGQSENNALWDATGASKGRSEDPDLTAIGHQQAQHVAQFLQSKLVDEAVHKHDPQNVTGFGITHLYTSLMIRAVKTASYISAALNLPPVAWPEIHEEGGIYHEDEAGQPRGLPGKTRSYFKAHHPALRLPTELDEDGWWNRPLETPDNFLPRAQSFLAELLQRHGNTEDRVAVVSHGAFFVNFMKVMLRISNQPNTQPNTDL